MVARLLRSEKYRDLERLSHCCQKLWLQPVIRKQSRTVPLNSRDALDTGKIELKNIVELTKAHDRLKLMNFYEEIEGFMNPSITIFIMVYS